MIITHNYITMIIMLLCGIYTCYGRLKIIIYKMKDVKIILNKFKNAL